MNKSSRANGLLYGEPPTLKSGLSLEEGSLELVGRPSATFWHCSIIIKLLGWLKTIMLPRERMKIMKAQLWWELNRDNTFLQCWFLFHIICKNKQHLTLTSWFPANKWNKCSSKCDEIICFCSAFSKNMKAVICKDYLRIITKVTSLKKQWEDLTACSLQVHVFLKTLKCVASLRETPEYLYSTSPVVYLITQAILVANGFKMSSIWFRFMSFHYNMKVATISHILLTSSISEPFMTTYSAEGNL